MLIRQAELDISSEDPFANDALQRRDLEPPLTQFVTQATSSFVLALDGKWGSGKTTFLRMWKEKLQETGHVCLYLNAWKTDFTEDPLIAVVGELSNTIENLDIKNGTKENLRETKQRIQKIAGLIFKRSLPLAIKLLTYGFISTDDFQEKAIADHLSKWSEDAIRDYENGKSDIEDFKQSLQSLANDIESLRPSTLSKVVVIVDELDRCRPLYAVQMLERIKHLFNVPGVVFILGIDRLQLGHSICALYGTGFDAQGYLRRFIDIDYQLPSPNPGSYCNYLFKRFEIEDLFLRRKEFCADNTMCCADNELAFLKQHLGHLMHAAGMNLREQEQTISRLRIVLQTVAPDEPVFHITLCLLIFFREQDFEFYESIRTDIIRANGKVKNNLVYSIESKVKGLQHFQEVREKIDMALLRAICILGECELSGQEDWYQKCKRLEDEDMTTVITHARYLRGVYKGNTAGFERTRNRIDFTEHFVLPPVAS
jgi:hypothetical protein